MWYLVQLKGSGNIPGWWHVNLYSFGAWLHLGLESDVHFPVSSKQLVPVEQSSIFSGMRELLLVIMQKYDDSHPSHTNPCWLHVTALEFALSISRMKLAVI